MATLLQPDEDPSVLAQAVQSGGAPTTGGGSSTGIAPAPAPGGANALGTSQADNSNVTNLNSSANFQPLLDTLGQGGTSSRADLDNSKTAFATALGTAPTFGDTEKNTLTDVLGGKQSLDTGRGLLNTTYGGPTGLNTDKFNTDSGNYSTAARSAQTPGGISALLSQINPEETQGENDFDTRIASGNANFKSGAQNLVNDSNIVGDLGFNANKQANDAITQRKSDIGAYNQAGTNFVQGQADNVNNMINQQMTAANTKDAQLKAMMVALQNQGVAAQNAIPAGQAATMADVARDPNAPDPLAAAGNDQLAFNRNLYAGRNVINPASYLSYTPGADATRNNVATQDEATQYNNAMSLLNRNDQITPTQRLQAMLGYNPTLTMPTPAPIIQQAAPATAAAETPSLDHDRGDGNAEGVGGVDGVDATGEGEGEGDGEGDGAGDGEGGGGTDSGGGYAKGGLIKKAVNHRFGTPTPPIGGAAVPTDPATLQPTLSPMAPVSAPTALAHGGLTNVHPAMLHAALIKRFSGGSVPFNNEPPGTDTVPTQTTSGEFVTRKPSVAAIGVGNMRGLNDLDQAPAGKQQMVRGALHKALVQRGR